MRNRHLTLQGPKARPARTLLTIPSRQDKKGHPHPDQDAGWRDQANRGAQSVDSFHPLSGPIGQPQRGRSQTLRNAERQHDQQGGKQGQQGTTGVAKGWPAEGRETDRRPTR